MPGWLMRLDANKLDRWAGVPLSPREIQAAAQDFEEEVGHDELVARSTERLELAFAAYLRKWVKRFHRQTPVTKT